MLRHKANSAETLEPRGGEGELTCPGQCNLIQGSIGMFMNYLVSGPSSRTQSLRSAKTLLE